MSRGVKIALKVVAWALFAVVLVVSGVLIATVRILTPEKLTPLVETVANKSLNAEVTVDNVQLSLRRSFPFLSLDVDNLIVRSNDILSLPKAARDSLPVWADTLMSVGHLHGGVNVFKLIGGIVELNDLTITAPKVNVLVVNDRLNNFNIALPSESVDSTATVIPDIRLKRFSLESPQPIRFLDLAQDLRIEARIASAEMSNSSVDSSAGDYEPIYHVNFDSNISSPFLEIIGQETFPIGFSGIVEWRHTNPYEIDLKDFDFLISVISGRINTNLNFAEGLVLESFDFKFNPLKISEFIELIPDSVAEQYYIPKTLETDAIVMVEGAISHPYEVGDTLLPHARLHIEMPPCYLQYGKMGLKNIELYVLADAEGGTANDMKIRLDKAHVEGPGTRLDVKGSVTDLMSDPIFDGEIDGHLDLSLLPDIITERMHASLEGAVTINTSVIARPSMFSRANFHKLRLAGDLKAEKFMYLTDDTLSMYALGHTDFHFGTNDRFGSRRGVQIDSLLSAKLKVDTANILVSGLDIKVGNLQLGVGAQNTKASTDTTLVIPMGGGLRASYLSLFSISDSAGLRIRNIKGNVSMRRYQNDAHLPLFSLNLNLGTLSTGNNHTRFMVNDGNLRCSLAKLPIESLSKPRQEIRHLADSLHRKHPHLSIDSVYVMAAEIRARNRRPGHHRVHSELTAQDNEIIDWGTSTAMQRLLLDWDVKGSLTANTSRLFTSSFPLRNRMENLNVTFNNDTISLADVRYKAGDSDFLLSGNVTNIKRAFTSKRRPSALKINFSVLSEYIDVNQLSHALFTGASRKNEKIDDDIIDAQVMEHRIEHENDSVAPLLIPTNIDAELHVQSNHVAYADFVLNDFKGTVLMYDGAINLHDLTASSEVGSIDLTALYSAPSDRDIDFGFGMKLDNFNIRNFLKLVPAVDTIMPMLRDLSGIIDANLALTTKINDRMDLVLPSVKAAINLTGDSLSFIDSRTFNKVAKWLMFKNKEKNMIDHVSAEMIVEDGEMHLFPFIFDFDRYRLGIQGSNDFDMNFNYHVAVLKSPIPFKFGINLKGNYDNLKIRLGRAKFNEKTSIDRSPLVNDTRINLINQFQNVFKRGVRNSKFASVDISDKPLAQDMDLDNDTLSAADSLYFKQEGLIPE